MKKLINDNGFFISLDGIRTIYPWFEEDIYTIKIEYLNGKIDGLLQTYADRDIAVDVIKRLLKECGIETCEV